jgi:hypothetical protein
MKAPIVMLSAASLLVLGTVAQAEQDLTAAQMDSVTAAGNAVATAAADFFASQGFAETNTVTYVRNATTLGENEEPVPFGGNFQVGFIPVIDSYAYANSLANAGGGAIAGGTAEGMTMGSGISDTISTTNAVGDLQGVVNAALPWHAASSASNTAIAVEPIRGLYAAGSSFSTSAATLTAP